MSDNPTEHKCPECEGEGSHLVIISPLPQIETCKKCEGTGRLLETPQPTADRGTRTGKGLAEGQSAARSHAAPGVG